MKGKYVPIGAYKGVGRERPLRRPAIMTLDALKELIPSDKSVVDIGAQRGVYARELSKRGYKSFGLDGIPTVEEDTNGLVKWCDLTGDCSEFYKCADWGLFFEVGEHVPKELEGVLIDNVCRIPKEALVVSWAHEGYGIGQHRHINCRVQVYIASEFAKRGWFVDEESTVFLRERVHNRTILKERIMVLKNGPC